MKEDGCKGAMIMSSLPGHYPDDDDAFPFFQLAVQLDVPVFVHPPSIGVGEERLNIYRLGSSVGRPMDGAIAISRMIVRGQFEKLPKLKLVASHLGGGICEMIGRMDYAYNLQEEAFFRSLRADDDQASTQPLPQEDVPGINLLSRARRALRHGDGRVDHFIFGTDAPPLKSLKQAGINVIRSLNLAPADEEKVFAGNAKKLLKI